MTDTVVYETPLNERMRTFLRLEHLFKQTAYTLGGFSVWDSRCSLTGLIQILDILSRGDLKNEILKELERLQSALAALQNIPGVDEQQLGSILGQIEQTQNEIHSLDGQFGQRLREVELISNLRQRSTITGGDCNFDLPGYHFWLSREPETRISQLEGWFEQLHCVQKPVLLILGILRESVDPQQLTATQGFYQQSLDPAAPVQLLRVQLPEGSTVFPEISAGKHRFSIRFLEPQETDRPIQAKQDVDFLFSCCAL